ncbi:MAG: nucleotide exchange factor GrpE [Cyclobacteriaceae bacterium]
MTIFWITICHLVSFMVFGKEIDELNQLKVGLEMQKDKVEENIESKKEEQIEEQLKEESVNQAEVQQEESEAETTETDTEKDETEQLKEALDESKDKYLRLYSEFENFRRRTAKERIDLIGSATKELILDLLPVLDDFERAFKSLDEKSEKESNAAKEGLEIIYHKFRKVLDQKGLKKIEIKAGDKFDPEIQEAITQTPAGKKLEGKVVDVIENGYSLNDKVVRFAKVVTGAKS